MKLRDQIYLIESHKNVDNNEEISVPEVVATTTSKKNEPKKIFSFDNVFLLLLLLMFAFVNQT